MGETKSIHGLLKWMFKMELLGHLRGASTIIRKADALKVKKWYKNVHAEIFLLAEKHFRRRNLGDISVTPRLLFK